MALFWGQFWGQLPIIYEGLMGDMSGSSPSRDYSNVPQGSRSHSGQNFGAGQYNENEAGKGFQGSSQLPNTSQQFSQGQPEPFGLAALSNALPDVAYQNYSSANVPTQRFSTGPSPSALMYQYPNVPQFANQQTMGQPFQNMQYNMGYPPQYQGIYGPGQTQQAHNSHNSHPALSSGNQFYQGQNFIGQQQSISSPFMVHNGQYGVQGQVYPLSSTSGSFGARGGFMGETRQQGQHQT